MHEKDLKKKYTMSHSLPFGSCLCLILFCVYFGEGIWIVQSAPVDQDDSATLDKQSEIGDPVWSHGESYAFASATGDGAVLETDSWTSVDNHGGLHVNNVTSDGQIIGYEVSGLTNCSQESYALATGAWSANALAYGWCNSSVLLDQPVSNTGYGKENE